MAQRKAAVVQEQPAVPVEDVPPYDLEPLNDDLRSRINVWGNSTQMAISQLEADAPEWARFLSDIFETIKAAVQVNSQ